ncbi:MAG TPA: glycogen-binding domain-containing protein [Longimicrobiales bacterium]|nr:glycogen-binding domain-containing protein [Longimicrobiales bacterium]
MLALSAAATAALAPRGAAWAQTDVTLEVGASQVGPPAGVDAGSTRFAVAGLRLAHLGLSGAGASAGLLAGRALGDGNGGDFVSASLAGSLARRSASGWGASLEAEALAFHVAAPFPYTAFALEGGPALERDFGGGAARAALTAGLGRSRVELRRREDARLALVFEDDLWRWGATAGVSLGPAAFRAGLEAGIHETSGGTYGSGGVRVLASGGWGAVEARVDVWDTPFGTETTGGLALFIPISGWSLRGFAGRSEPDPLTLAEPGSGSFGLLVGRTLWESDGATPAEAEAEAAAALPYDVLERTDAGARVRLRVEAPAGASRVEVLGDFTLWEAVPMHARGSAWEVELTLPAGVHHYGFLVDGAWWVPDGTDVVPDEWGRESAILVIEGDEP